jgi:hypothetical protein
MNSARGIAAVAASREPAAALSNRVAAIEGSSPAAASQAARAVLNIPAAAAATRTRLVETPEQVADSIPAARAEPVGMIVSRKSHVAI